MSKNSLKRFSLFVIIAALVFSAANFVFAQENESNKQSEQIEEIPPPLVALSTTESEQLRAASDLKRRTQISLALAENRLKNAEKTVENVDFQTTLNELAAYEAIVTDNLKYLQNLRDDSKKVRDNMRRIETTLREHMPRIEAIRRQTPMQYAVRVKEVLNFARDARSRALDTFFSDTVLIENKSRGIAPVSASGKSDPNGFKPNQKP
jgi:DNA repair ATPase RecN